MVGAVLARYDGMFYSTLMLISILLSREGSIMTSYLKKGSFRLYTFIQAGHECPVL
jgi:hypothetical protein